MKKEDILEASRKENKKRDLAELEVGLYAGSIAGRVGATVCCLLSLLSSVLAHRLLYSPWMIYFSILGTNWLVRAVRLKKKSDWAMGIAFIVLAGLALVGFMVRLLEVAV